MGSLKLIISILENITDEYNYSYKILIKEIKTKKVGDMQ